MKKLVRVLVILVLIVIAWQYFGPEKQNRMSMKNLVLPADDTQNQQNEEIVEEAVPFVPEKPLADVSDDIVDESVLDDTVRGTAVYELSANNQIRRRLADAETVYERTTPVEKGSIGVDGTALVDGYFEIAIAPSDDDTMNAPEELFTERFKTDEYPIALMTIEEGGGSTLQVLLQINGIARRVNLPSLTIIEDDSVIVTIDASVDLSQREIDTNATTSDFVDIAMQLTFSRTE